MHKLEFTKNKGKYIKSLHQTKFRQKYNKFIAEGDKISREFLLQNKYKISSIYITNKGLDQYLTTLEMMDVEVYEVTVKQMQSITALKNGSDILLECNALALSSKLSEKGNYFYLDGIQDPGNVGTIMRIADWFGMKGIIVSPDTCSVYNPKVVQAAMGSMIGISILEMNRSSLLECTHKIYALDMNGQSLGDYTSEGESIYILGNEGNGVNEIFRSSQKVKPLTIEGSESKVAESLNVGMAAAILAGKLYI